MSQLYRITLNPWNTLVQRDLSQPYEMHRTLSTALHKLGMKERMLYRVEIEGQVARVLVQTATLAGGLEEALPEKYAVSVDGPKSLDSALNALKSGRMYRFRLLANPTVKLKRDDGSPVRVPLLRPDSTDNIKGYLDWLQRKGKLHGFELVQVIDSPMRLDSTIKGQKVPLIAVCFDGLLKVNDAERLREAVSSGIGSGKAFGFGLLSIGPA
jgi:CRISPR system Cascade subunit CasE